jgi:preprotein translocase subunit SecB
VKKDQVMAEPENFADIGEPYSNGEDTAPAAGLLSQYVKDFSFENPNSPGIYTAQLNPTVDVQFGLNSAQVGEDVFEVVMKIEVKATQESQTAFLVDLSYAGLFAIRNVSQEQITPFLLGEAPRLLFPFARRVLADAVRDGGFPPLLLDPIDFQGLYQARMEAEANGTLEAGQA